MKASLSIFLLLSLIGCTETDINIPNKQAIGLSRTFVAIYSPVSGSTLSRNTPLVLDYEVLHGIKTSYVKIQIDKKSPITVAKIKGRHHIEPLSPGPHTIMVSEYRSDNNPSGSHSSIRFNIK